MPENMSGYKKITEVDIAERLAGSQHVFVEMDGKLVRVPTSLLLSSVNTAIRNITDSVVNNLTTTEPGFTLDARQGKALKDEIDVLSSDLADETITLNDDWMYAFDATGYGCRVLFIKPQNSKYMQANITSAEIFLSDGWHSVSVIGQGFTSNGFAVVRLDTQGLTVPSCSLVKLSGNVRFWK